MTRKKIAGLSILALLLAASAYVANWFVEREKRLSPAHPVALAALTSTESVTVSERDWIVFSPATTAATKGLIFYPGGECDERGYAELLAAIAAEGYLVVLVPMPLQLAVLAPGRASSVIEAFPGIDTWAIGGHSLGGAMAARYVFNNPGAMDGLLFWDAYPPETDDISQRELAVRLVHRANEAGEMPDYYNQYIPLLPAHMDYAPLAGAVHINFGRFIPAERFRQDGEPTMPIEEQHRRIVDASINFMVQL